MGPRRNVLIFAACLIGTVTVLALLTRNREPRYQGRSLSEWLQVHSQAAASHSPDAQRAADAIRSLGTNAIPFLLKWIRHEPPPWQRAAQRTLPESISESSPAQLLVSGPGNDRASSAVLGFALLGSTAAPAIPDLVSLAKDRAHPRTARRAILALSVLGPPAFPEMEAALSDTNHPYRDRVAVCLGAFMPKHIGTNACLAALRGALSDPDPATRIAARKMLNHLAPEALTNAPVN